MNINDFQKMNYKNVKISEDARIAKQSVVIGDVFMILPVVPAW